MSYPPPPHSSEYPHPQYHRHHLPPHPHPHNHHPSAMNPPIIFPDQQHSKTNPNGFIPAKSVFIGDLSYFCNEDHLIQLFSPYGRVTEVNIRRGVTGDSLLYGFLAFDNEESATRAQAELNGREFMGRYLR